MKNILFILVAMLLMTACGGGSDSDSSDGLTSSSTDTGYSVEELESLITSNDTDPLYSASEISAYLDAAIVALRGKNVDFTDDLYSDYTEDEYTVLNGSSSSYEITTAGTYVLSGTITSTVEINVGDKDDVRLVLNGVNITSTDGPAIAVINADDVEISVVPDTVNSLEDAATRVDTDAEEYNAALYSDCDLVLNSKGSGSGTLNIVANYEKGLNTKDDLKLIYLILNVTSVEDGIRGNDSVAIYEADITVDAAGDALKSTKDDDTEKGYVYIASGKFNLTAGDKGLKAENLMLIYDGDFTIDAADKAIKSESAIYIGGGTFDIVSTDDGIDSNTNLNIYEGTFSLASGDDALKATSTLTVYGGTIEISDCYEGLEAEDILIYGGYIDIASSDDAINAASDDDEAEPSFYIENGAIIASPYNEEGDGIDINGSAEFAGGVVIANGPAEVRDNAIDIDDDFIVTNGKIFTFGNAELAVAPSTTSSQPSILFVPDSYYAAGTLITLMDDTGEELMSLSSLHDFNHVILSHPDLSTGSSYTVEVGSSVSIDTTLSSAVTYIDEDGVTTAPVESVHR
jgi:hypothetical protein